MQVCNDQRAHMQPQVQASEFGFVWGRPLAAAGTRTPKVDTIGVGVPRFVSVGLQAYTRVFTWNVRARHWASGE